MQEFLPLLHPLLTHSKAVNFVLREADKRIVYLSEAYEQVFGDPAAHATEDWPHWLQRVHPDDRRLIVDQLREAEEGQLIEGLQLRVAQSEGRTQWLRLAICRVRDAAGAKYLSGSLRDNTAAREVAINAHKFNTKKNATLEILSHDLAAPLALLQQLTEHLRHETGPVSEEARRVLELMERTCREGVTLIRDFVDNEFMESASVKMKWERADLGAWLQALMEEYQGSERHTHLQFSCTLPPVPVYVNMDINKFQQVVNNLVSNAIKFTPDGGHIALSLEQHKNRAVVRVVDNGVGIPASVQPVLFDKFTPARRPGLRGEKTTGLGMSIIQTIVELHHGRITFESTEGQGSTFIVELPAEVI
ncbi:PAS domain-containing sensor histidine kinase [Hymenobacter endophyticus]|uniref:histidine kinase n=1 Tax=Hymenobacter endophyticus TaxID=3076335 RepID=A0ABU3TH70_9BACT|nr:HAMP domain-containing sensor histidine kinase [Hymenobacter endophyticus]MDU0370727.1 HAMP domain-containing sensor histidine kinase [Hymenobacter endophyticus]